MDYAAFLVRVRGVVQGVGFRYFAYREASLLNLSGYVKNLFDGRVEVYAEGPKSLLNQFLETLRIGPQFGHVDNVEIEWQKYEKKYEKFLIMTDYNF